METAPVFNSIVISSFVCEGSGLKQNHPGFRLQNVHFFLCL
ncbi:hypothetical protein LEP1GSC073_4307 [Leptospira noguchii str. Cascata]|nr:hypothetical protein LEP1GSC073_4307 [Leptospira noguchii str. Cascata]